MSLLKVHKSIGTGRTLSLIVPLSRTFDPRLIDMGVREERALAASLVAGIQRADVPSILDMLDASRPPTKRFRRRYGRRTISTQGYAKINMDAYFELERTIQSIARYDVRNRLPAVLTIYELVSDHGIPTSGLFHNGLLSGKALSAIISLVTVDNAGEKSRTGAVSRHTRSGDMKNPTPGTATSHFIAGVQLPMVEAEPDVVVAFKKHRATAIQGAEEEVDETEEIKELLGEGRALLASLD